MTLFFHLVAILAINVLLLEQSGFLGSCTVRISWNYFFFGGRGLDLECYSSIPQNEIKLEPVSP